MMSGGTRYRSLVLALSFFSPALSLAQEPADLPVEHADLEPIVKPEEPPNVSELTRYWANQDARPFVGGHVAVGGLNRVMLAAGYGKPHWLWGGLQFEALTTSEFGALYGGLELELLLVNLAVGYRGTWAYSKGAPAIAPSYSEADVYDDASRPRSKYQSVDVGLWGYVPAGPTLGYWEITGSYITVKPVGSAIFDEYLRFTISDRLGGLARVLWGWRLWQQRITIGPMFEVVGSPGRPLMVRAGAGVVFALSGHVSIKLNLAVPLTSPDTMGWFTQSFASARLTWSWASGEPRWGFR